MLPSVLSTPLEGRKALELDWVVVKKEEIYVDPAIVIVCVCCM